MDDALTAEWTAIQRSLRSSVIDTDDDDACAADFFASSLQQPLHQRQHHNQIIPPLSTSSKFGSPAAIFGGLDISFPNPSADADADAAAAPLTSVSSYVLLDSTFLRLLHEEHRASFAFLPPYVAGFLSFRELPLVVPLVSSSSSFASLPTVLLVDGNGLLHPNSFGSASHIGVSLNVPSIGVSKSLHSFIPGVTIETVKSRFKTFTDSWLEETTTHVPEEGSVVVIGAVGGGVGPPPAFEDDDDDDEDSADGDDKPREEEEAKRLYQFPVRALSSPASACKTAVPSLALLIYNSSPVSSSSCSSSSSSSSVRRPIGAAFLKSGLSSPIFVSVGHRISLRTAIQIVDKCSFYRVPEPIRQADIRGRERVRMEVAAAGAAKAAARTAAAPVAAAATTTTAANSSNKNNIT